MVQILNGFEFWSTKLEKKITKNSDAIWITTLIIFSIRACDTIFFSAMLDAFLLPLLCLSLCILLTDGGSFQISGLQ